MTGSACSLSIVLCVDVLTEGWLTSAPSVVISTEDSFSFSSTATVVVATDSGETSTETGLELATGVEVEVEVEITSRSAGGKVVAWMSSSETATSLELATGATEEDAVDTGVVVGASSMILDSVVTGSTLDTLPGVLVWIIASGASVELILRSGSDEVSKLVSVTGATDEDASSWTGATVVAATSSGTWVVEEDVAT